MVHSLGNVVVLNVIVSLFFVLILIQTHPIFLSLCRSLIIPLSEIL